MAECRLCKENKRLVKSHIFPEFMYKPLYDENSKFKIISLKNGSIKKEPSKGIYERLLCERCDNEIIGKYENHASKILFGDGKKEIEIENTNYGQLIRGVDYKLFKLFQMSLLWRTSISKREEIHRINLGPHEDRMRKMILNEDPGEFYDYGVIILLFPESSKKLKDLLISPELLHKRIDGHRIYRAIFNGLVWVYFVSSNTKDFNYKNYFLSKDGTLPIVNSGIYGEKFIRELMSGFINMNLDSL